MNLLTKKVKNYIKALETNSFFIKVKKIFFKIPVDIMRRFIREIILSIIICSIILRVANYHHFGISITLAENADIATIKGLRGFFILGTIFRIVNFILKKLLHIVSWPLKFLTFGIISLVINIGVLYLFQRFVNHNYGDIATVQIAEDYLRAFILSIAITLSY